MQKNKNSPVSFSFHALESARKRGANKAEIKMAIQMSDWKSAKRGRLKAELEFDFNNRWNGIFYSFKKVNPIFIIENDRIIVITVYCFYY